jgi:hypothetical protein
MMSPGSCESELSRQSNAAVANQVALQFKATARD